MSRFYAEDDIRLLEPDEMRDSAAAPELVSRPLQAAPSAIVTAAALERALCVLGLGDISVACVHSSLNNLGYVIGGARSIMLALRKVLGKRGTVMMPAFSGDISDPVLWKYPAVPSEMVETIRNGMPPFDPALTPTYKLGAVAEYFRTLPGTVRSGHPQSSFCANGPQAHSICIRHPLGNRFGPRSPLGVFHRLDGHVLLLGASWNTVSFFYLSEFAMPDRQIIERRVPQTRKGSVHWKKVTDLVYRNVGYAASQMLVDRGIARRVRIGQGQAVLFPCREALRAVTEWRISSLK